MSISVKVAQEYIDEIKKMCDKFEEYSKNHEILDDEAEFIRDVFGTLCDYRVVLETAIENAEIDIGLD